MIVAVALFFLAAQTPTFDVDRAMHGVVLLVTDLGGGNAGYGAGVVINADGDIVTNLHVLDGAKRVQALPYDPQRPSLEMAVGGK